jgi:hypothetical protein
MGIVQFGIPGICRDWNYGCGSSAVEYLIRPGPSSEEGGGPVVPRADIIRGARVTQSSRQSIRSTTACRRRLTCAIVHSALGTAAAPAVQDSQVHAADQGASALRCFSRR